MNDTIDGITLKELETYPDQHGVFVRLRTFSRSHRTFMIRTTSLRFAYDSPEIDFDWLKSPPIK